MVQSDLIETMYCFRVSELFVESGQFLPTQPAFVARVRGDPVKFRRDLWYH